MVNHIYWKFNNSLCADKEFVERFKEKINELKEQCIPISNDKLLLWDFMKMKMREFIISYSKEKAKVRRKEIEKIEKEIKELENKLLNEPSKSLVEEIEMKKDLLSKMYDYSRQGLRVRSRADWFEEGEKKTQYFEQLLKSNKRKRVIREIYNEKEQLTKNANEILKTIKAFYEKLYSTKEVVQDKNSIFLTDIPKLNKDNQEMCEGKVTKN